MTNLEAAVDELSITEDNLVPATREVTKYKDLSPVGELCKKILKKCADAVNQQKINFLKLWSNYDESYGASLQILNRELNSNKVT